MKNKLIVLGLSAFYLFALMNPVFKKYDYGAGFPLLILFGIMLGVFGVLLWKKREEKAVWDKLFLLLFMGLYALSFVFSKTQNLGFPELLAFLSVGTFYLLFAYRKIEWKWGFLRVVGLGAILAVVLGFVLYVSKAEVRMVGPFFNTWYRSHQWPNGFALFLILIWPVLLLLLKEKFKTGKAIILGLVLSALLLSYSRGALIAFGGQIVLLGVYYWRSIDKKLLVWAVTVALLAVFFFSFTNYVRGMKYAVVDVVEKAGFENAESLTSKTERVDFWKGAIAIIKEEPLLGYGPFSFRYAYNPHQTTFLGTSDHPHNIFLKIGAENGLPAMLAFLGFLISGFVLIVRRFKGLEKGDRDLVVFLGVAVAGAIAHNLIDYNFNFFVNLLLLFVFLTFMRSAVVGKEGGKCYGIKFLAILLAVIALYEGVIFGLSYTGRADLTQYLYPRLYYIAGAQVDIENGDYNGAIENANTEIELNPIDGEAHYLRGVAKFGLGDKDAAVADFAKAIELDP
ncbi:O-antigen ligase family protein, partial [Patescibacteria group bacterium]|nr:O-antigen ligase family protein [Patescibacteria group bacterium]